MTEQLAKQDKRCDLYASGIKRACSESLVWQNPTSQKSTEMALLTDLDKENEILTLSEIANVKCSNIDETRVEVNSHILILLLLLIYNYIMCLVIYNSKHFSQYMYCEAYSIVMHFPLPYIVYLNSMSRKYINNKCKTKSISKLNQKWFETVQ